MDSACHRTRARGGHHRIARSREVHDHVGPRGRAALARESRGRARHRHRRVRAHIDDDELAGLCRMLRAHGWTRDVKPPEAFADEYDFQVMGYNVRPLELHAAIARAQLLADQFSLFVGESEPLCETIGRETISFCGDRSCVWDKNVIDDPSE